MSGQGIQKTRSTQWLIFGGDVFLILAATQVSAWIRFLPSDPSYQVFTNHSGACLFTLVLHLTVVYIFDLYDMQRPGFSWNTAMRMATAVVMGGLISAIFFYSLPQWMFGRGIFLIQMILIWAFLFGWRALLWFLLPMAMDRERVLILGAGVCGKALALLLEGPSSPYEAVGFLDDDPTKQGASIQSVPVLGPISDLEVMAKDRGVRSAFLAITRDRNSELIRRVLDARLNGLAILDMPVVYERLTGAVPVDHIRDDWLVYAEGFDLISKRYIQRVKRIIDFGISTPLLLATLPLLLITCLAIRLDSPGPAFFKQARVGKDRRVFTLWKFRSMKRDAEQQGAVWAQEHDPRVTRVGRFIRVLRLDELPQVLNVFLGDMSLIGPRPERPEFVAQLQTQIPYYGVRHAVRPGITGWAQVNYPYGATVEDAKRKLEYDIFYIKNMSLGLDLKIVLKTIGVVLFGQGAR